MLAEAAADARISTWGGSTSAFDSDGRPLQHKAGFFTTSRGVVETKGGETMAYDDLDQPVFHKGGRFRSEPNYYYGH